MRGYYTHGSNNDVSHHYNLLPHTTVIFPDLAFLSSFPQSLIDLVEVVWTTRPNYCVWFSCSCLAWSSPEVVGPSILSPRVRTTDIHQLTLGPAKFLCADSRIFHQKLVQLATVFFSLPKDPPVCKLLVSV